MDLGKIVNDALTINEDKRMLKEELLLIAERMNDLYKGGNTLEIGAYKGMTSYVFASILKGTKSKNKHYIVDIFDKESGAIEAGNWAYDVHTKEMMEENLKEVIEHVDITRSESLGCDGLSVVLDNKFDYCFIDGDHRYPVVFMELMMVDLVTDHIFLHDYGHQGVTDSVDRFCDLKGYTFKKMAKDGSYGLIEIFK